MPRRTRRSSGSPPSAEQGPTLPKLRRRPLHSRPMRDAALGGEDERGRRLRLSDEEYLSRNAALRTHTRTQDRALSAEKLELHVDENRRTHHTAEYEHDKLIVRRGQPFTVTVTFSRPVDAAKDDVLLQLTTGARPQESKLTLIRLPLLSASKSSYPDRWQVGKKAADGNTFTLTITPSAEAIVGIYKVFLEVRTADDGQSKLGGRVEFPDEIIVLFNPWCIDDQVYMEIEEERQEYVMNESGRLYVGSARQVGSRPWDFGQFEDVCLDAALYLLDKAELVDSARSNPIHVIRTISQLSNSNDEDGGVLTGRWTESYPKDSTEPWAWNGSVAILEQFMKSRKAVRFGQCWVFSGLVTTLLRSLGIPTRSVTNFESAHDCDASMTIDYHWNENDEPVDELNDSVWNFHVWNESWLKRPDLPEGYGGWQAHDATPQELSQGVMRCGPAPVRAIKEGQVYFPYDTPFVFAEVNGDRVHWLVTEEGVYKPLYKQKHSVGLFISTKAVGSHWRNDVTHLYKHKEGSSDEREAVHRAFRYSSRAEYDVYDTPDPDVHFDLDIPDSVVIGDPLPLKVRMQNTTNEERKVKARLSAVACYYTGVPSDRLGTHAFVDTIPPQEERVLELTVPPEDYLHLIKPEATVKVYIKGTVQETDRCYACQDTFTFTKPTLVLEAKETGEIGEPFDLIIKFINPLKEKLTGIRMHIEAAGIVKSHTISHKKPLKPGEELSEKVTLQARRAGSKEIIVSISSDQLSGVNGVREIRIKYQQ